MIYIRGSRIYLLLAICLVSYSSMIVLQAFNADDIIQGQPAAKDYNTFLAQGRWGYYLVYKVIQEVNPLGPASLIFGIILLMLSSAIAAFEVKLKHETSLVFFILISTISLYYSSVFSFDSTRIAYPFAGLLAIMGVVFARRKQIFFAVLCLAVSPAIFTASAQISLTFICAILLLSSLRGEPTNKILREGAFLLILLIVSLVAYIISTHLSVLLTDIPLSGRSGIDPVKALYEYERLVNLFVGHSLPLGYQLHYFNPALIVAIWLIIALFLISILMRLSELRIILAIICIIGLLVSPFALAFASPLDEFSPRALVAFSLVHATFASVALDTFLERKQVYFSIAAKSISTVYVLLTAIQINGSAFDEYLSSRNDILATNRIISRIDEVVSRSKIPIEGPIPIVVQYREPVTMSPRGAHTTARAAAWSKEWIFRQIDPRFVPVPLDLGEEILERAPDTKWPDPTSVYVDDTTVVVIVN